MSQQYPVATGRFHRPIEECTLMKLLQRCGDNVNFRRHISPMDSVCKQVYWAQSLGGLKKAFMARNQ